jgi:hypothetical protein
VHIEPADDGVVLHEKEANACLSDTVNKLRAKYLWDKQ